MTNPKITQARLASEFAADSAEHSNAPVPNSIKLPGCGPGALLSLVSK